MLGCAAQSPPRPPRVERPLPVRDLALSQVGANIELQFTLPTEATDGEPLSKPLAVEIFRSTRAPEPSGTTSGTLGGQGVQGQPWVSLEPRDIARDTVGGRVKIVDRLSSEDLRKLIGWTVVYSARPLTRGFRRKPIAAQSDGIAGIVILDVPAPPGDLTLETTAKAVKLNWSQPRETITGKPAGPIGSYRIYRSDTGKPGSYRATGDSSDTAFADSNFEFGHFYSYRVRALVKQSNQVVESEDSAAAEIIPRDTFPPAPPAGLTGLYTANAVELIWDPSAEPDLAGYNVYRSDGGQPPAKINSELLRSPLYRDAAVSSDHRYIYRVAAVDVSGNESGLSAEVSVDVP